MERQFNIGDIVYSGDRDNNIHYEVVKTYAFETKEKHFVLKRLNFFNPYTIDSEEPIKSRIYSTEKFKSIYWILIRDVMIEKIKIIC